MTPEQKVYWQKYIDYAVDHMRLSHWTVTLSDDPPENELAVASVLAEQNVYEAYVHLAPKFFTHSPDNQRSYIAHELIHLQYWQYYQLVNELCYQLGSQAQYMMAGHLERTMELATDNLAKVVRLVLDEPDGPKDHETSA